MSGLQNLFQQIAGMQWSDYLDILLVAYAVYNLLPLIRTPNTMRIARAVLAVLIIAWLTGEMNLHTVNYILNQVLAVGILAVIVLFQPELRRMLDRLGNVRRRSILGLTQAGQDMAPIIGRPVAACGVRSREKVGAQVVFARGARLEEYFKAGTQIDGQVSEQLIRNIFFVKAPLHDGAMIIRDGRIAAAGCVLPLSDSNRLSADLGTRHRAGVGMSEVSDAVVVIVSEETGTISVAVGGMLKRHLAPQTLARLLSNELRAGEIPEEQTLLARARRVILKIAKEDDKDEK